jgi:hypothetical protein
MDQNVFIIMAVGRGGKHRRYHNEHFATLGDALDWIDDNEEEADIDNVELYVAEVSK